MIIFLNANKTVCFYFNGLSSLFTFLITIIFPLVWLYKMLRLPIKKHIAGEHTVYKQWLNDVKLYINNVQQVILFLTCYITG